MHDYADNYDGPEVTLQNARRTVLRQIIIACLKNYPAADVRNLASSYEILRGLTEPS